MIPVNGTGFELCKAELDPTGISTIWICPFDLAGNASTTGISVDDEIPRIGWLFQLHSYSCILCGDGSNENTNTFVASMMMILEILRLHIVSKSGLVKSFIFMDNIVKIDY